MHGIIPPCWGVAAALAWIAARDEAICEKLQVNPKTGDTDIASALAEGVEIGRISEFPSKFPTAKSETGRALVRGLQSGEVRAWAVRNGSGGLVPIGAGEWNGFEFIDTGDGARGIGIVAEPIYYHPDLQLPRYGLILIAIEDMKRKWPAKPESAAAIAVESHPDFLDETPPKNASNAPNPRKKGGRHSEVRLRVEQEIREAIRDGSLTVPRPKNVTWESMAIHFNASRHTIRDAWKNVVERCPEFNSGQGTLNSGQRTNSDTSELKSI